MQNIKEKVIQFLKWVKNECKDRKTIALFVVVVIVMYSPVWGGYLLHYLLGWNWCLVVASTYLVFWAGPFTPYFPLCIAITLGIKRVCQKLHAKENNEE